MVALVQGGCAAAATGKLIFFAVLTMKSIEI